jgi:hypothetical protein
VAIVKPVSRQRRDPERIYDELLRHSRRCPSCRPWLDQLYEVRRLCPVGKAVVELYALTVALATEPTPRPLARRTRAAGRAESRTSIATQPEGDQPSAERA